MANGKSGLYTVIRGILKVLVKPVFLFKCVKNKNNIPETGAYILCANHISLVDCVFLAVGQKRQLHYMAKQELFKNKLFGWFLRKICAFPVNRDGKDTSAIRNAINILNEGHVLGIFPEGTRSKDGKLGPIKAGTLLIAKKSGAPIVPAAIYTKKNKIGLFCGAKLAFGEPLTLADLGVEKGTKDELNAACETLREKINALYHECENL